MIWSRFRLACSRRAATRVFVIGAFSLGISVLYLLWERLAHERRLKKIPLRVCITGTRGKSSVSRLIAAAFREAGYRTLAKTTGSKPVITLPNGEEREIKRRGAASVLEQKKIVRLASRLGVEALVVELMSVQRECLSVESACLLKPHLLVITNVRLDHLDLMGSTKSEIAGVLASAIRPNCTVFVPEGESCPEFSERAGKVDANFIPVAKRLEESDFEFPENLRLAMAVSESVGLIKEIALHGMRGARPDFGSLRLWGASFGTPPRNFVLANGFAANDPESSLAVLARIKTRVPCRAKEMIGLFNLREDRGDRSLQWLQALQTEPWSGFDEIVFAGYYPHALNLKRRLGGRTKARVRALPERNPEALMARIVPEPGKDVLVLGLGNIQGLGQAVVEYWDKVGIPYGY